MNTKRFWILVAALIPLAGCPSPDGEDAANAPETAAAAPQLAVQLDSGDAKRAGSTVTYAVRIDGGPSAVKAFGLDVRFDPATMSYIGWETGALTDAFTHLGANQVERNTVRIGGFTADEPIQAGAQGSLAVLQFEVVSQAPANLEVSDAVDDVDAFSTSVQ